MASRRNTLDMTNGPILRKLLLFAYPLIINTLINTLYGTADKIVAGRFINDNAMAAVGVSEAPLMLLLNFFGSMGIGVSVACGSHLGAKRDAQLRDCMHTALLMGVLCGMAVCVVGMIASKPLLLYMETPAQILPQALTYMLIRMLGTPISMAGTFCTNILSAHGDTKRITVAGMLSGLINVIGNLVFVLVFGMGIEALAIATVLSQAISLIVKLTILFSPRDAYHLQLSRLRMKWQYVKEIFSIGLPSGLNSILFSGSNVIVQGCVNSFGATVVAGNAAADTLINFVFLFPNQIVGACSCAAAQCFGAGDFKRIAQVTRTGILTSVGMTLAASIPVTVFSVPLLRLFTEDPAVAVAGVPNLLFSCWGYAIYCFSQVYSASLRGMHKTFVVMILNTVGICLPRVLWAWFVFPLFGTPAMLYIVYPISWGISSLLIGIYYYGLQRKQLAKG